MKHNGFGAERTEIDGILDKRYNMLYKVSHRESINNNRLDREYEENQYCHTVF